MWKRGHTMYPASPAKQMGAQARVFQGQPMTIDVSLHPYTNSVVGELRFTSGPLLCGSNNTITSRPWMYRRNNSKEKEGAVSYDYHVLIFVFFFFYRILHNSCITFMPRTRRLVSHPSEFELLLAVWLSPRPMSFKYLEAMYLPGQFFLLHLTTSCRCQ